MAQSPAGLLALQISYVLSGSATVLIYQWQNGIVVDTASGRKFVHPIGQVVVVYIAMVGLGVGLPVAQRRQQQLPPLPPLPPLPCTTSLATTTVDDAAELMPAFATAVDVKTDHIQPSVARPAFRWYHAAAPGILHFVSLLMTVLAVQYTTAAIVQILRGSIVIFAAALTRALLGRTLARFQYFGIVLVMAGVLLVSAATLQRGISSTRKDPFGSNPLLGDTLIISAQFFLALRGVLEERVMKKHNVHELEMAGWEGVCALGSCVGVVALGIVWPTTQLDDLGEFVTDMGASKWALISTLLLVAIQPILQGSGLYIIKACSAVTKTVLSQLRIVCVWVPSVLFMGGVVSALQLAGFAVLTLGAMVYTDSLLCVRMPGWCYTAAPDPSPEAAAADDAPTFDDSGGAGVVAVVVVVGLDTPSTTVSSS